MLSIMTEVTLEEFESNYEKYMDLIESGNKFMIRKPDGTAVAAVPAKELDPSTEHMSDDEWYNSFNDHDDAS